MPKIFKFLHCLIILTLLLFYFESNVIAATIPYTITEGIPGQPVPRDSVFYTTEFKVNYQSGRILLSANPDGTGNTQVDDAISMTVLRPNGTTGFFDHFYPNNFCSALNFLVPSEVTNLFLPGENTVRVQLRDACGGFGGSSPLYLVNLNAPEPTPTPSPSSTPTPSPSPTPVPSKTPLILIPGIGGSELKVEEDTIWNKDDGHGGEFNHIYPDGEKVWVNEGEAANPGEDDYFDVLRMKTDGVTPEANIGLTGNLYSGAYQGAIDFFTSNGYILNQDLFVFPYDWRLDISGTATLLDQKIQSIKQQTGFQKVDIVAHSMGGLVARNYIADSSRAQNVRKLFTLGTPHLGSVKFLKALRYGVCLKYPIGSLCPTLAPSEVKDVLQNTISGFELTPSQSYFNFYSGEDNQHPSPYKTETGTLNYMQIKSLLTNFGHNTSLYSPSEIFHSI